MVVRGQLPACEEDLQALAALRLQCLMGDFSTHSPCPSLDELFPGHMLEARVIMTLSAPQALPPCQVASQGCPATQRFPTGLLAGTLWSHTATAAHKQKVEQDMRLRSRLKEEAAAVMGSILERWKSLAGYSRRDSMAAYLTIARQWSGFGCTLYEVEFYIVSVVRSRSCKGFRSTVNVVTSISCSNICLPLSLCRVQQGTFPKSCGWVSLLHPCLFIGREKQRPWSPFLMARSARMAYLTATLSRSQLGIGICFLKPQRYGCSHDSVCVQ